MQMIEFGFRDLTLGVLQYPAAWPSLRDSDAPR